MPHGDRGVHQPSCATVPLGKSVRRAFRAAIGMPKKKKKNPPPPPSRGVSVSMMELSSSSSVAARKEAVVRVVMRGGVVEVYPAVVLACTVIRNHPPGLCLAHPDVFRNPHGAVVRPLEPLFPGQKFLLLPESTVVKLKQKIPESSVGAFADDDVEEEDDDEEGDSAVVSSSSEGEASAEGDGTTTTSATSTPSCSAREYFVASDRWSECRSSELVPVEQEHAVEASKDDDEPAERKQEKTRTKKGNKKRRRKGRRRRDRSSSPVPQLSMGLVRGVGRTWEPSLPSVEEEEEEAAAVVLVSPLQPPPSESSEATAHNTRS